MSAEPRRSAPLEEVLRLAGCGDGVVEFVIGELADQGYELVRRRTRPAQFIEGTIDVL